LVQPLEKRKLLTRDEMEKQHGADPASIRRIETFARKHGLSVVEASAARRTVVLSGTVAAMNAAFGVELKQFEHPNGTYRGRTGPVHIPAELQNTIEGVFGLDNRPQAKPHFRRRKDSGGVRAQASSVSYTPLQVANAYNFPGGTDGSGECIALIELGGGFVAGWGLMLDYTIDIALFALATVGYLGIITRDVIHTNIVQQSPYYGLTAIMLILLLLALNVIGIRYSSKFNELVVAADLVTVGVLSRTLRMVRVKGAWSAGVVWPSPSTDSQ
jgi:amino acid transporter